MPRHQMISGMHNTRHTLRPNRVAVRYDDPLVGKPQRIVGFADVESAEEWVARLVANTDVHPELFSIRGAKVA